MKAAPTLEVQSLGEDASAYSARQTDNPTIKLFNGPRLAIQSPQYPQFILYF